MQGKKTSNRIKQDIAETALEISSSNKIPIEEVPINQVANNSNVSWSTAKKVMTEDEFEKFVNIKKKELTYEYSIILNKIIHSIKEDLENGRFDQANPISKFTSFGIVGDKLTQLIGKENTRLDFTQNIVNVSEEISKLLNKSNKDDQQSSNR